jgi:hypothetical protein
MIPHKERGEDRQTLCFQRLTTLQPAQKKKRRIKYKKTGSAQPYGTSIRPGMKSASNSIVYA